MIHIFNIFMNIFNSTWQLLQTTNNTAKEQLQNEPSLFIQICIDEPTFPSSNIYCPIRIFLPTATKHFEVSFHWLWPRTITNMMLSLEQHNYSESAFMLHE